MVILEELMLYGMCFVLCRKARLIGLLEVLVLLSIWRRLLNWMLMNIKVRSAEGDGEKRILAHRLAIALIDPAVKGTIEILKSALKECVFFLFCFVHDVVYCSGVP